MISGGLEFVVLLQANKKEISYIKAHGVRVLKVSCVILVESIKFKFHIYIIGQHLMDNIHFIVHKRYSFFYKKLKIFYTLWPIDSKYLKYILILLNYINLINTDVCYYFNYIWSSFEIMCTLFIILLLRNMKLFTHYIFLRHITYNV